MTKAPMPTARDGLAVGVVNGILYAVGGFNGSSYVSTVEAYDPVTNTWTTKAPMPTARYLLAAGVVNGVLYAVGGFNGSSLSTVEAYNPATNTWTTDAPMPTKRDSLAASVVNAVLYAAGGIDRTTFTFLSTVEAFTPAAVCQPGDEDNGKGMVADENGNNGGEFDDNECDNNHNLEHKDPNHNMMFTASAHGPAAFSGNGLVATSVGQGIANGQPVNYVLVQTGGPAPYFYSLTLSDASGVIYRRNGQLILGVINVGHR
jgi:hypothetical protein